MDYVAARLFGISPCGLELVEEEIQSESASFGQSFEIHLLKQFNCIYSQLSMHSDFVISRADGRPMYVQIMEQIRQRVAVGDWPKGGEIPSIRQLAVTLSVSVITIKRAYLELEREGVIVTQHGRPSRVAAAPDLTPRDYAAELAEHLKEAARLADILGLTRDELCARAFAVGEQTKKEQP